MGRIVVTSGVNWHAPWAKMWKKGEKMSNGPGFGGTLPVGVSSYSPAIFKKWPRGLKQEGNWGTEMEGNTGSYSKGWDEPVRHRAPGGLNWNKLGRGRL